MLHSDKLNIHNLTIIALFFYLLTFIVIIYFKIISCTKPTKYITKYIINKFIIGLSGIVLILFIFYIYNENTKINYNMNYIEEYKSYINIIIISIPIVIYIIIKKIFFA